MPQLFPVEVVQNSVQTWLPRVKVRTQVIYITVLVAILLTIISLPFIKVDVSVKAGGLVRPVTEKNELRAMAAGTIEEVLVTEGQKVQKGQVLLRLQEDVSKGRLIQANYELGQREAYIHDLRILSGGGGGGLQSPLYRQQYQRFQATLAEQSASLNKLKNDLDIFNKLYSDKVIAQKELHDKKFEYEKVQAVYNSTIQQQRSAWQEELGRYEMESSRLQADTKELQKEQDWNLIKAPVSGTLQQFSGRYAGGNVQGGELLGVISPDSNLIGECYVSPRDIAYLHIGMPVKFQVDAFNYNEWGLVEGKVRSVDNDFVLLDNQPVFKVRCEFEKADVETVHGVKGSLKKGMTLQARFIITKRSLFQLLYDKADDWINPNTRKAS